MVYNGSGKSGKSNESGNSNSGNSVDRKEDYEERVEPVLVLFSNLYLLLDSILVGASRLSSYPILYHLLTTYFTNYCPNQICI